MQHKRLVRASSAIALASLVACGASCTTTGTVTTTYGYSYVAPMADVWWGVDPMMWDYGYYAPYYLYAVIGQVVAEPEGGVIDGGSLDGAAPASSRLPRPLGALLTSFGAQIHQDCLPTTQLVDADGDGIPASYSATFNCTNQIVGDRITAVVGMVTITDSNDASATGGLSMTFTSFFVSVVDNGDGTTRVRTLDGTATFGPSSGGTFQGTHDLTIAYSFSNPGETPTEGTLVTHGTAVYTPDAPGSADPLASGVVELGGEGNTGAHAITRSTNPPLHWSRSCRTQSSDSSGFDGGNLLFKDDIGSTLQLQFMGCRAPAIMHVP